MTSGEVDYKGDEAPTFGSSAASSISTPSLEVPIQTNLKPIPVATQAPRFAPPPQVAPVFQKPPSTFPRPIANPYPNVAQPGYATNNVFQVIPTNPAISSGGYAGYTPQAAVKSSLPPTTIGDPNNDATIWTEHDTPDGRKYWYNRATLSSTYEKPFCLKTPEERSIQPCKYKEYSTADGKKYYSDGVDSL
jgi:hypothetical protein